MDGAFTVVLVFIIARLIHGTRHFPTPGHTHGQTRYHAFLTASHRRRDHGACSSTSRAWCRGWMRTDIEASMNAFASYRLGSSPCGGRLDWKNETWPAVAFTRQKASRVLPVASLRTHVPLARHTVASRQPNKNSEGAPIRSERVCLYL